MNRRRTFGTLALVVLIIGIALYVFLSPAPAKAPGSTANLILPDPYTEETPQYAITANYPTTTPLSGDANSNALDLIQQGVIDAVSQFKNIDFTALPAGVQASLRIVYLISSSPHTVSYIFTIYTNAGGAQGGNTTFTTYTFDTATGERLALGDLFKPGADYLDELSNVAQKDLPAIIGKDADAQTIAAGTAPDEKNFSAFFIDNGNLDVLYGACEVASCSDGTETLQIPLTSITDILKPEYQP